MEVNLAGILLLQPTQLECGVYMLNCQVATHSAEIALHAEAKYADAKYADAKYTNVRKKTSNKCQ